LAAATTRTMSGPIASTAAETVAPVVTTSSTIITGDLSGDRVRNGRTDLEWFLPARRGAWRGAASPSMTGTPIRLASAMAITRAGSTPYLSLREIARGTGTRGRRGTLGSRTSATSRAYAVTPRYLRSWTRVRAASSCSNAAMRRKPSWSIRSEAGRNVLRHSAQRLRGVTSWHTEQIIPLSVSRASDTNPPWPTVDSNETS